MSKPSVGRDLVYAAAAALAIFLITFGVDEAFPDPPLTPSQPFTMGEADQAVSGNVIMRVNGDPVTEDEFNTFLAQAPQQMQGFYSSPDGRRLLADEIVKVKLLEQEAKRQGLQNDPETRTQLQLIRTNILATAALRKLIGKPEEGDLRAAYEQERKNLETIDLSHILIAYEGGSVPAKSGQAPNQQQAMRKAQAIARQLRGGGNWEQIVRTQSDDTRSAEQGGFIGSVPPGSMPPALDQAAMALKQGEISDPVPTEFGIHILKAGERRVQPFEAVREALSAQVSRTQMEQAVNRLHREASVELDPKFFPPVAQPQGTPAPGAPRR